ncbi:hypothetical protein BH18ACT8_BH18ACT8_03820 [soil metagenome]
MARSSASASSVTKKDKRRGKTMWKLSGRLATLVAGFASLHAVNLAWRVALGRKPPATPENPEVTMREAAIWAVLSGSATQLAKLIVTRRAVDYYIRSTGQLPPGVKASQISPDGITKS